MNLLLADIGATKSRFARSDGRRIVRVVSYPTPARWTDGQKMLRRAAGELFGTVRITRAVVGIAGQPDRGGRKLVAAGNIKGWVGPLIQPWLARQIAPIAQVFNDAVLNGLGEAVHGAGRGHPIVGFLTLSTGINGVRIVQQRLDRRAFEPELRHFLVSYRGQPTTLGRAISGRALAERHGRPAERITEAAVWRNVHQTLAEAIVNLGLAWAPTAFVLGGGLMKSIRLPLLRSEVQRRWRQPDRPPRLMKGELGDHSGLYGALVVARDRNG